jgi:hypothetical protein
MTHRCHGHYRRCGGKSVEGIERLRQPQHPSRALLGDRRAGLSLSYVMREEESQVELYIDLGAGSDEQNLELFKQLEAHRSAIESAFGGELDWQELTNRRACRIRKVIEGGYRSPQADWPKIHEALVDSMIRLDKSIRPFVQKLDR